MARPTKQGIDYFPMNCHMSDKIEAVESVHGNDGFTVIIKAWQVLYQSDDGLLDCSGVLRRKTLAKRSNITEELWVKIIETCIDAELFDRDLWKSGMVLRSNGVVKRMEKILDERRKGRERAAKRWDSSSTPNNYTENDEVNDAKGKGKGKGKGNEKEIVKVKREAFQPPSQNETLEFFIQNGSEKNEAGKFWFYYDSNGWMVGKNKMKSWTSAAHKWIRTNKDHTNGKQRKGDSADIWNAEFADLENRLQGTGCSDMQEFS